MPAIKRDNIYFQVIKQFSEPLHVKLFMNVRANIRFLLWSLSAVVLTTVVACSPRKNTAASRNYQAFITRYNIYYNGDTHMKETLADMEDQYEDDYSGLVLMHPAEAKGDPQAPQPTGDFTRSIEKGQKAIQLRSIKKRPARKGKSTPEQKAWLKRDEYNPFLHNAWMLMAKGQYYNGDFLGAASTFFYISKHFTWLPATVTEAQLWQARSYVALDWLFEAEVILKRIKPDELTDKSLRGLYDFTQADWLIHSDRLEEAVPFLKGTINTASGAQKTRLRFLLGQLYARLGEKQLAYDAFKAAGSSPSASYRTKFNARIKQSEVYQGSDIEPEVKALRRMTRYDRNKDYLDQVYYAIGNLYLSRGDTVKAIANYELAAEKSTRNGIDKAISQITLGNLYFALHRYDKAQPCYSEAVPLLPKDYPDYAMLVKRSDVLDELAVYAQNVTLQDSLLHLASLPEAERLKVVEKIIEDLKKKEKEEAEAAARDEYMANNAANPGLQDQNAGNFQINSDNSWYFYNTATKNSGKTEFQRRWGARKLEDNWRRRNKSEFNAADWNAAASPDDASASESDQVAETGDGDETKDVALAPENDPHKPEYYLAQIPSTPEEVANSHEIIQDGLYNMGVILKDKLEDFPAAIDEFDRLMKDYPDNVYRLDVYYNLYLIFAREGRDDLAERYRRMIVEEFPDSPYGMAMSNPDYLDNLRRMDQRQQALYDKAYSAYLNNSNDSVHAIYQEMMSDFPLSKIMPKFMFLHALAYVTEHRPEDFNSVLRELLERYPDTDITPIASAWLKGMADGRELQSGTGGNLRGMIWDQRLGNDSTAVAEGDAAFEIKPDDRYLIVFTFPTDEVESNALLYEIARHNFKSFTVKDFDLEPYNFGRLGMIVLRDFENLNAVNYYRNLLSESGEFTMPAAVRPVVISDANFKLLMTEGRSFDDYFRFLQEKTEEAAEALAKLMPTAEEELEESEAKAEDDGGAAAEDDGGEPAESTSLQATEEPAESTPAELTPAVPPKTIAPAMTAEPVNTAEPAKVAEPVIVPIPVPNLFPTFDPGSEGDDDPLLE